MITAPTLPTRSIGQLRYTLISSILLLSQHLAVALVFTSIGTRLRPDLEFWLLPLRRFSRLDLPVWAPPLGFLFSLFVAGALAGLSFGRARRSGWGYALAALTIVPGLQIGAVFLLAFLPRRRAPEIASAVEGTNAWHVAQGVLSAVAIIVLAVLLSSLGFGSYGWGLFIATPFLVGVTTAYIANRQAVLPKGRTWPLVLAAAALGTLALVLLALEGAACILMATPLGALAAIAGGSVGRMAAISKHERVRPLMSVALLPVVFAFEAAMPPALEISSSQSLDIHASQAAVWAALTSSEPIAVPPGLTSIAGLAYPVSSRLLGRAVGAERIGNFSTGAAHERITTWTPGRRLAFTVLSQPPAMHEMSPYGHVHSPHVSGYFETVSTTFDLAPLNGGTRLTVSARHILRIDPVLYWEPLARWAIADNVGRVLQDIKYHAEARSSD